YMAVFSKIMDYAADPKGKGIHLYGNVGVGKTYLMMALCNEFASQGMTVAFLNVSEFLLEHKTKIDYDLLEKVKSADFMVLDDIGQESVIAYNRDEILFPLLNDRMMMGKATCFTSNFDFAGLQEHFCVNIYNDREELKALRVMERIKALSKEVNLIGKSRR
ncbi:MAG: ATP-binding protein, partial [Erysipelotrichales bacterium]|nr:ATP-binding protein [Erysipelotrichales bacterium]